MVSKKSIDYGFRGFQAPKVPKCPRSARKRVSFKKPAEDGQACAFELLASLAGQLLQESESSACSNASEGNHQPVFSECVIEQERQDEVKPLTEKRIHNGSCEDCILITEAGSPKSTGKRLEIAKTDCVPECVSANNTSDCWEKFNGDVMSEIFKLENKIGHHSNRLVEVPNDQETGSSVFKGLSLDNKDPLELGVNSPALVDVNSDVKSPFCGEMFPNVSFTRNGNDIRLGFRDDDENFIRCNKVCTKSKASRHSQCIARQIIWKRLTSRPWKVAPKLKDCEHSRYDNKGIRPFSRKRKTCYNFERSQCYTFKRKKFFYRGSVVTPDGGFSSESVSDSADKGISRNNRKSPAKFHVSKDSHVKFSIKSFRIPELYVEVPETATVDSLKRTVMEAVMNIIGGGVQVGVLVQGKKVRDDNKTLLQTGISCKENLDKLSFELEPSTFQASLVACVGDPPPSKASQPTRSLGTPTVDSGISVAEQDSSLLTNTGNLVEINHDLTSSPTDTVSDKLTPDSTALVAVPARSAEALSVVPLNENTKHSELVQRRARRPFSVSEVEALVQAVEEVGTGRWRDVKLRAFEDADYRTYVDLKDKWKTLVHTAKISPQQRRGEPVPQELLDRVLATHAFWSHHQAKQHCKHQGVESGVLPLVIM